MAYACVDRLMDEALKTNIAGILQKQLESGDRDKTRMSLICLKALCMFDVDLFLCLHD